MEFLYVLGILLFLLVDYMIASEFANIAEKKGYDGTKYKLYTFFFGIAGMLMVVALPQKHFSEPQITTYVKTSPSKSADRAQSASHKKAQPSKSTDSSQSLNNKASYTEEIDIENADNFIDTVCAQCGKEISVYAGQENLRCPWCYTELDIRK